MRRCVALEMESLVVTASSLYFCGQDINCLDVSPNDKLIVSASQDKTAKVSNRVGGSQNDS